MQKKKLFTEMVGMLTFQRESHKSSNEISLSIKHCAHVHLKQLFVLFFANVQ